MNEEYEYARAMCNECLHLEPAGDAPICFHCCQAEAGDAKLALRHLFWWLGNCARAKMDGISCHVLQYGAGPGVNNARLCRINVSKECAVWSARMRLKDDKFEMSPSTHHTTGHSNEEISDLLLRLTAERAQRAIKTAEEAIATGAVKRDSKWSFDMLRDDKVLIRGNLNGSGHTLFVAAARTEDLI